MVSNKYDKHGNNYHIGMGGKSPANRKSSGFRPPAELTQKREVIIYDLSAEGKSLREIAAILNSEKYNLGPITFQGVGKALHRINDRELAKLTEMVKHEKIMQTNSLRLIFRESMSAWKRSKEAGKRVRKRIKEGFEKDKIGPDGQPKKEHNPPHTETSTELIEQNGDPRFLAQARETLADIRKIWGIDAPTKHAHTDPSGENEFGSMTPEERADRLAEMIDIIRARIPEGERNGETLALEAPQDDEPELDEDDDLGEEYEPDVIDAEGFPSEGEDNADKNIS